MRTNIDIDDALMAEAQRLSGHATEKETVEAALRLMIELNRQDDLYHLCGTVDWSGDLEQSRLGRTSD